MKPEDQPDTITAFSATLQSWADEVREYDLSLTTLQRQAADAALRTTFLKRGLEFTLRGDDEPRPYFHGAGVEFKTLTTILVEGTGTIDDICPSSRYPITLQCDDRVEVAFQPRPLSDRELVYTQQSVCAEWATLNKKARLQFRGRVISARYYSMARPKQPRFTVAVVAVRPPSRFTTFLSRLLPRA